MMAQRATVIYQPPDRILHPVLGQFAAHTSDREWINLGCEWSFHEGVLFHHSAEPKKADHSHASSRSFVVVKQAAESRTPANPALASVRPDAIDQPISQPLMIALLMIVGDELCYRPSEVALANRNDPIETFLFDRSHEAFRVRIRRLKRCLHDAKAGLV
jgi:hypothetical protein